MSSCRLASGREGGQRARSVKKRKNVDHVSIFRGAPAYPGGVTGRGLFYKPPGAPFPPFTFLGFARRGARNWAKVKMCTKRGVERWLPFKKGDTNGILKMWIHKKVPRQPPQWTPPITGGHVARASAGKFEMWRRFLLATPWSSVCRASANGYPIIIALIAAAPPSPHGVFFSFFLFDRELFVLLHTCFWWRQLHFFPFFFL